MNKTARFVAAFMALLATLTACDNRPQSAAPPAQSSEETFKDFGNYELHFNAIRTDLLSAEVARSYGIQRSKNKVLLNVTVLKKNPGEATKPVDAEVTVGVHNLNAQVKDTTVRKVTEGEAIYYIGEVSIGGSEILVFDINAKPAGESQTLDLKFKREFFAD
jgi:hypothetical protein